MGLQISQEVLGSARLCAEMVRCRTSRSEPDQDQGPSGAVKGLQQSHQLQDSLPPSKHEALSRFLLLQTPELFYRIIYIEYLLSEFNHKTFDTSFLNLCLAPSPRQVLKKLI